jgi:nucleotide-binding universal stress UspA family protein
MYRRILIPLENSESDAAILEHIRPLAKLMNASLILIHVAEGYVARLQDQLNLEDSEEIRKDQEYIDARRDELAAEGFDVKSVLVQGEPVNEILAMADKEECDLIAMATHGHRFVKDFILGSVATSVRHRTKIPVLMVRAPSK